MMLSEFSRRLARFALLAALMAPLALSVTACEEEAAVGEEELGEEVEAE